MQTSNAAAAISIINFMASLPFLRHALAWHAWRASQQFQTISRAFTP
jgi:hypothetical protein